MKRNPTKTGAESKPKAVKSRGAAPSRATKVGSEPSRDDKARKTSKPAAAPERQPELAPTPTGNAGSERALDEEREGGPRYGGGAWEVADERGDRRYGHARNDDGEPAQIAAREADSEPGELPAAADPELDDAAGDIEGGGQHAGMGRGEKPRKLKSEE